MIDIGCQSFIIINMRKSIFINDHLYHIFNRGVEKRTIFLDDKDYRRFLFGTEVFNDVNSTINLIRLFNERHLERHPMSLKKTEKDPLVKIICFCLMPNHFHFVLKQIKDGGISKFMQKLGIGYTKYFNQKYERSGVLFQGKFKSVLINRNNYLNYLTQYIHSNPLELIEPNWKERGIKNYHRAENFLNSYRWMDRDDREQYSAIFKEFTPDRFVGLKNFMLD